MSLRLCVNLNAEKNISRKDAKRMKGAKKQSESVVYRFEELD